MFEFCNWELKLLLPGRPRALQHVEALVQPVRSGAEHGRSPQALGAIEDSISQGTFLQMTYTAENPHADGSATPGAPPCFRPPRRRDPHATSPAPTTTGWREDKCPVVSKRPVHSSDAAKMSPHIRIGPEPVLAVRNARMVVRTRRRGPRANVQVLPRLPRTRRFYRQQTKKDSSRDLPWM